VAVYVALLRGINVGKSRRVAMADLRAALDEAGYGEVTTHLQSGNVVLSARERSADAAGRALEDVLRERMDLDIDVIVRTAAQLEQALGANPLHGRGVDTKTLHVGFLKSKPKAAAARALDGADFGRDEFALVGRELYLRYPDGQGRSKMSGAFFERALATPMTVRNWAVVTKLAELARER
jgi:uncharacterized protein (DUF1697 family)